MSDSLAHDLRGRFRETSRTRLEEMYSLLAALEQDLTDAAALQKLARHFHGLAGMGATYGFPRVSELGDEAEAAILPLVRGSATPDRQLVARWREVVGEMESVLGGEDGRSARALTGAMGTATARKFDVLIVEDEAELATLIANALTAEGFSTRIASNRETALAALNAWLPNALIVDLRLPDGSGYEVLETLRRREGGEAAGAIVISVMDDFVDKVRALRSGADAFVGKPLDLAALVRRVDGFRARRQNVHHRILAVEDDATTAVLLRGILGAARYEVEICRDPAEFERTLVAFEPDLILMDVQLSHDVTGHDLVRYVRQSERFSALPIIIVTSDSERQAIVESANAGADTLVTKPVDWELLLSQIARRLERATAMRELTERDALTGVLTRVAFEARVRERLHDRPLALVLLDLDHFKVINDTHGHAEGDRLLAMLGGLLRRNADIAGRYGGEEFSLLLDGEVGDAVALCERLLRELSAAEQGVTFSAGVAAVRGSYDEAFRRADAALYAAKRGGRARIVAA